MMNNKLTPGNYFIELAFRRPVSEETLRRSLVAMGFSNIEMDKNDDGAVGALSLASSSMVRPLSSSAMSAVSSVRPATTSLSSITPVRAAPTAAVLAPAAVQPPTSSLIKPTLPTGGSSFTSQPAPAPLAATPVRAPVPTGSSQQYSMQPAPSQSLADTPLPAPVPTGSSQQYSMQPAPSQPLADMTVSQLPGGTPTFNHSLAAAPATGPGGLTIVKPSLAPSSSDPVSAPNGNSSLSPFSQPGGPVPGGGGGAEASSNYSDGGLGSPNLATGPTGGPANPAYQPAGGGGGDQSPGPNDGGGAQQPAYAAPQSMPDYSPAPYAQGPTAQDDVSQNSNVKDDTLVMDLTGGSEAAVLAQLTKDLATAEASPALPPETRWHRWVEWGSPFASVAPHLANVSGEEEESITRYRFVATLSRSLVATNAEDMSWVFIRRLAINPFADLAFLLTPYRLVRGGLYEFRFFSRVKSNPTKDSVKDTLAAMGFAPLKLNLLKKNMRIPHRNNAVSLWLGIGRWTAPNSVVTNEDPFFFETLKEVKP